MKASPVKVQWTSKQIAQIYHLPFMELLDQAHHVFKAQHKVDEIQVCTLLSIKTGGCSEDCSYCRQSAHYRTDLEREKMISSEMILEKAKVAQKKGSTRFCMGAAWSKVRDNAEFEQIKSMIREISLLGMEVCCTLGRLTEKQAIELKDAGLTSYNHNLDTSEQYYSKIVTTRTYADRLLTIDHVQKAGIRLCCGGIIGMGEKIEDRLSLLHTLSHLPIVPDSVPINALIPISGTPMENLKPVNFWEMFRMVATARIIMPTTTIRLAAGREKMSQEQQALCFYAGANSIFSGDKLLTTANHSPSQDTELFNILGLKAKKSNLFDQQTKTA